jgi:5-methylcytosine-specific restriction endonuclease McrA
MAKTTSPCRNCGTPSRFRFCRSCIPPLGHWATCPLVGDHVKAYARRYQLLMRLSTAAPVRSQRVKVRLPPKLREVLTCQHGVPGRCDPCGREHSRLYTQQWRAANPERTAEHRAKWNETRRQDEQYVQKRRARNRRRRAILNQVERVEYRDADIFDRDRWTCHLCGKKIPKAVKWPDSRSPSIDHLIPISLGGADAPWNVRAAHVGCNLAKHTKAMNEQLMLIG